MFVCACVYVLPTYFQFKHHECAMYKYERFSMAEDMSRCRIRKLPKGLKEWQAFLDLQKKIVDFNESCPLLELMANKAMKPRHWDRISNITGHKFDLESDAFALKNIMDAPLLEFKEDIEVIFISMK